MSYPVSGGILPSEGWNLPDFEWGRLMRWIDQFVFRLWRLTILVALFALGATAGMKSLATGICAVFTRISTQLSSSIV